MATELSAAANAANTHVFNEGDSPYLQWIAAHNDALVLNTTRNPKGYTMLHLADCRHISQPAKNYQTDAFTAHDYFKVVAMSPAPLVEWAESERPLTMPLRICATCDQRHNLKATLSDVMVARERAHKLSALAKQRATITPDLEAEHSKLQQDLAELDNRSDLKANPTTRTSLVEARLGQGKYREQLLTLWGRRCAVTNLAVEAALVASHAVAWSASNDSDRLDPHNGLPLAATIDKLFDRRLISFEPATGKMLVSKALSAADRELIGLPMDISEPLSDKQQHFIARHREEYSRAENERIAAPDVGE